jgi:hypothetical protein
VFERYTLDGRTAVAAAAQEAHESGREIGPGELLIGVARGETAAAELLRARGGSLDALREAVAAASGGPVAPYEGAPRFTSDAQRALDLAADDAGGPVDALRLLIGLLREESGAAVRLLAAAGARVDGLDGAAVAERESALAAAPALDAAPERAIRMAYEDGREVDGGDLLLALAERDAITSAALAELGVSGEALREAVRTARGA